MWNCFSYYRQPKDEFCICFPKKGGITVVPNKKFELISTKSMIGWLMCMDCQILDSWTK